MTSRRPAAITFALIVLSAATVATPASAQSGCRQRGLASDNASRGINANAPSRAILNPCSSMYRGGVGVRRMEKRRYPHAIVRH